MQVLPILGPLFGVLIGWGLKTLSDYFLAKKDDSRIFQKAAFHLLKTFKSVLDFDRGTAYKRSQLKLVADYDPWHATLTERLVSEMKRQAASTESAVEFLASVDAPLAIRLHNTIKNLEFSLQKSFSEVAAVDERAYAALLKVQDDLIAFTLNDLKTGSLRAAEQAGGSQRRNIEAWIKEREEGKSEFDKGMDENLEIRNRAFGLAQAAQVGKEKNP